MYVALSSGQLGKYQMERLIVPLLLLVSTNGSGSMQTKILCLLSALNLSGLRLQ